MIARSWALSLRCVGERRRRSERWRRRASVALERSVLNTGHPERQRAHLPESPLSSGVSGLPAAAGVHDALYARAERFGRAFLSKPQRRVHLADELPEFPGGEASRGPVDRVVQHVSSPPGPRLLEPA